MRVYMCTVCLSCAIINISEFHTAHVSYCNNIIYIHTCVCVLRSFWLQSWTGYHSPHRNKPKQSKIEGKRRNKTKQTNAKLSAHDRRQFHCIGIYIYVHILLVVAILSSSSLFRSRALYFFPFSICHLRYFHRAIPYSLCCISFYFISYTFELYTLFI